MLAVAHEELRGCGLSNNKVRSAKCSSGPVPLQPPVVGQGSQLRCAEHHAPPCVTLSRP